MADYLLDTNHASKLMANEEPVSLRVRRALMSGSSFVLTTTVLGELFFAVYASQQRERNLAHLLAIIQTMHIWTFDRAAADEFGRIRAEQRVKGRPIPPMDAQVAAVGRVHGLTILTSDHHFQFVSDLTVDDWTL